MRGGASWTQKQLHRSLTICELSAGLRTLLLENRQQILLRCGPAPFQWTVYRLSILTSSSCNFSGKRSLPLKAVEALGFLT
jgi:hypothetical protein